MRYSTGETIEVGDHVLIERGLTTGIVDTIVSTEKEQNEWNVEENGVLIKSKPFGLVFWPVSGNDDPVIYVSRKNT